MRHDASAPHSATGSSFDVGALVVVAGEPGVWRIERFVGELRRCFSYVDGRVVVVDVDQLAPCPPGTRADH